MRIILITLILFCLSFAQSTLNDISEKTSRSKFTATEFNLMLNALKAVNDTADARIDSTLDTDFGSDRVSVNINDINEAITEANAIYASNYTTLQLAIDAAEAIDGSVVVLEKDTRYTLTDALTIQGKGVELWGGGQYGTTIYQSDNSKTAIELSGTTRIKTTLNNIRIVGAGKGTSTHIGINATTLAAGSDIVLNNCKIDSFEIGFKTYDQTGVKITNSYFSRNGICLLPLYQSDNHSYDNVKFYDSDTVLVTGSDASNTSSPFTFTRCTFGRDSVNFMLHNENVILNVYFNYFEDNRIILLNGDAGSTGSVGNNINVIGNWFQGTDKRGWVMRDNGLLYFVSNQGATTALDSSYFIEVENGSARVVSFGNKITGGKNFIRFSNTAHSSDINQIVFYKLRNEDFFDMNVLTANDSTSSVKELVGINSLDRYFDVMMRKDGNANNIQYIIYRRDLNNHPVIGMYPKGGFLAPENTALPTASADYKGMIWHYSDAFYVCIDDGAGGYTWGILSIQGVNASTDKFFYPRDIYIENGAGYYDPDYTTVSLGFDRSALSFHADSLEAAQLYLTPEHNLNVGSTVNIDIFWCSDSTDTDSSVIWGVQYSANEYDSLANQSMSTSYYDTVAVTATANTIIKTTIDFTIGGKSVNHGDEFIIRIKRAGNDVADDNPNAKLLWTVVRY